MSKKKKKSRIVHAVKPDPGKPAVFAPAPSPSNNGIFDPADVVKQLDVWWRNGTKQYFRPTRNPKEWISVSEQDVKRKLRLAGVFSRSGEGASFSQADCVMDYIQEHRYVDFAGRLAGHNAGVHYVQERPIVVLGSPVLVEPKRGDWPMMHALLNGMFPKVTAPDNREQLLYLYAWLKVAITALRAGECRGGPALVLVGPSDSGKSFLQEHVITQLLGKRSADPTAYMLNKTAFNAELLGSEHLAIQELPSGLDHESRAFLGEQLKKIAATEGHSYHPKGCDAQTMYPFWRLSLSINKNPDRIKSLPPLNSDITDKLILLLVESKPMPMPTRTVEERRAFRETIYGELPAFVFFLLDWTIPPELQTSEHAGRFGHDTFHHPQIVADLFEQEPESGLRYMIDNVIFIRKRTEDGKWLYLDEDDDDKWLDEPKAWGWEPAMKLHERLTSDSSAYAAQAKRLFNFPGACGTLLSRLLEKFPQRFKKKHTNTGNVWMIHPPD